MWSTAACAQLHSEVNIYSGLARTGWTAAWAAEHWQATQQPIRSAFSSTPDQDHRSLLPTCLDVTNFYSLVDVGWQSVKVSHPMRRGAVCSEGAHIIALPCAPNPYGQRQLASQDQRQHVVMLRLAHMSILKPRQNCPNAGHA